MKKVCKKVSLFLVALLASINISAVVSFAGELPESGLQETGIELRYTHLLSCESDLAISNGTASVIAMYGGKSSFQTVTMTVRLQKLVSGKWTTLGSWGRTYTQKSSVFNETLSVGRGTYRVSTSFNVNKGAEVATATSGKVVY